MNNFLEKNKIPVAIILAAVIIGLFILLSKQPQEKTSVSLDVQSPSPTVIVKEEIEPSPTAAKKLPSPTVDDAIAIKAAMSKKIGVTEENLEVTVSKNTGQFAKGSVKEKTEVGGAYFLAAKKNGAWIIVYDGQSQPPCQDLDTYNFPKTLAPECLTDKGQVVKR